MTQSSGTSICVGCPYAYMRELFSIENIAGENLCKCSVCDLRRLLPVICLQTS